MVFCTLTTESHIYKCRALAESLKVFGYDLYVCQVDKCIGNASYSESLYKTTELNDLGEESVILNKMYGSDKFRWSLKPVLMRYLLTKTSNHVVYVDNDFYFFNDPSEIKRQLEVFDILLTPHLYINEPFEQPNWFEANYRVGLYNAGFIASNLNGLEALEWWSRCCIYNIKKSAWRGLYDDQKYLDLMPIKFPNTGILSASVFNVAGWNDWQFENQKEQDVDIVCVHFADLTLRKFSGPNHVMNKCFLDYQKALGTYKSKSDRSLFNFDMRRLQSFLYFMIWKFCRFFERAL